MSRSQNLRHNVINQVIDDMARGHIPSPLPSQSALAAPQCVIFSATYANAAS